MNVRPFIVVLSVAALAGGCQTNPRSVKSSAGKEIVPSTGDRAEKQAESLDTARGGVGKGRRDDKLESVALFNGPEMPVGIAVSKGGRTFMSFPRWQDPVKNTLVELKDGKTAAFPDEKTNSFDATKPSEYDPSQHLISVQAIVFDDQDRLWVLDPGSFNFAPNLLGGPKLWAYDISTGRRVKAITFPTDVALKMTALNDVRFDLTRGPEGTAYITDSGKGGIVVVDLATGNSWRHLDGHPSVLPAIGLKQTTEGEPFLMRKANNEVAAPDFRSDGIALSPDGKTLYYNSVVSRDIYAVPTDLLADPKADGQTVAAGVKVVATKPSGNDGILCDPATGRIYTTDFEDNAIRQVDPKTGDVQVLVQDERLLWPDTLALRDGYLYVTSNQLARQPNYHFGKDVRKPPYGLFRVKISG
ncbi:MAG TPA: L-dopachrome tautomerase-related protein [Tepidisphaeraceae bacterium]|jgi:sugar lactone lactonase YvrE